MDQAKRKALSATGRMRDALATQKAILDAAEREFSSLGLAGARTEVIASETNVTKAMIHHYFQTKERLYEEVIKRLITNMIETINTLSLETMPADQAIKTLIVTLVEKDIYPNYPGIMMHESLQNKGKYFREYGGLRLQWELITLIKRGIADGLFRPITPEVGALAILGAAGYIFPGRYNLSQLFPGQNADSKDLHQLYLTQAIDIVIAGLRL